MGPGCVKVMILSLILSSVFVTLVKSAKFDELFEPSWSLDHVVYEGEQLKLKLDHSSGAGFGSKSKYLFGKTTVQIKLVEGDSAGTVTAFYMSSDGPKHNEFDFEFLGNTTGEPYLVQTNIYINGVGNREERQSLWFDPSKEFHSYSILWNQHQVVFLVDETPIRVYSNKEKRGVPFPKDQPMGVYSSIWNADDWATQGGRVKTDWTHAPFVSSYKGFEIDGCECSIKTTADQNQKKCTSSAGASSSSTSNGASQKAKYWWDEPIMSELNMHQHHQLLWVRANHQIYDYCTDNTRFPVKPLECDHRP
ncbi:hypothetical protein MKW94_019823 [Papaver nudicaule]|uniref:Xyloglucan endotransglucosylase/hydrolase n=1 Tax=Papaver nudicaule TaxID=74823 RepID=A0AA41SPK2_PAPNU|nr:hypothetical protein [Papaver nudicaule]